MSIKLLRRIAGKLQQYTPVIQSAGAASAGEVPGLNAAGKLDDTLLPDGIGDGTRAATASEALTAGKFVNEFDDGGVWSARLADNSNGRPASGFVKEAAGTGAPCTVHPLDGTNGQLTGLTAGTVYYLGTTGDVLSVPLDGTDDGNAGKIDQRLGTARSTTELLTDDFDYVVL